jgi:hypothetical protein
MAKQACRGLGIALDEQTRGRYVTFRFPYRELPAYDVVFARGQSALEALVCGCAVVLLADGACGPLVTPENLRALAAEHFLPSAEACAELSPLAITEQLQPIHQDRVGETCRIAREMFDLELACDDLLLWHKEVIEENRADPPPDRTFLPLDSLTMALAGC